MSENRKNFAIPLYVECGSCGQFHPQGFYSDCRDDLNRFTVFELDAAHPDGWDVVSDITREQELEDENNAILEDIWMAYGLIASGDIRGGLEVLHEYGMGNLPHPAAALRIGQLHA